MFYADRLTSEFVRQGLRVSSSDFQLFCIEPSLFLFKPRFGLRKFGCWYLFLHRRAAHERSHFVDQASNRLKWFRQDLIRANSARLRFVERLQRADEKHHRNVPELLVCFDVLANLITT